MGLSQTEKRSSSEQGIAGQIERKAENTRKQQSIHDPSEEEDEWEIAPSQGELDELVGEGEINELNGLGNGEVEYVRKDL